MEHSAPLLHPPPTPRSTPPPPVRPTHPRGRSLPVLGRAVNGPRRLRQRIPWSLTTGEETFSHQSSASPNPSSGGLSQVSPSLDRSQSGILQLAVDCQVTGCLATELILCWDRERETVLVQVSIRNTERPSAPTEGGCWSRVGALPGSMGSLDNVTVVVLHLRTNI